jgi:hypothetical protein
MRDSGRQFAASIAHIDNAAVPPEIPDNGMISAMRKKINSRGRLMRQA